MQDGDRDRLGALGFALVVGRCGRREDLVSDRTTLYHVPFFGSLDLLLSTYRIYISAFILLFVCGSSRERK